MTPAEAHVWIAVFAAGFVADGLTAETLDDADLAVVMLRESQPQKLKELDEALRQGGDIP